MFGYVSIADLSVAVRANLHRIPADVDLIVGIPRSGMIPAYMIGLLTNRAVIDVDGFIANRVPTHGTTRRVGLPIDASFAARHVLLVDDSIASGESMQRTVERVRAAGFGGRLTTCAAIALPSRVAHVDIHFAELPMPRIFEWNAFHHAYVEDACFDLDGVLCVDPTRDENDDGPRYRKFLSSALPRMVPTRRIGHIVSARLEKYRDQTQRWLQDNGIQYGQLHLIDLPSQAERIRQGAHHTHKAKVYRDTGAVLFYESDSAQARQIATLSGKPVLCTDDMSLHLPGGSHLGATLKQARWNLRRPVGRVKGWLRHRLDAGALSWSRR
ncbi:MAG: phosphoribosyltransferase family protein [Steroidobacteraceae bacterium]